MKFTALGIIWTIPIPTPSIPSSNITSPAIAISQYIIIAGIVGRVNPIADPNIPKAPIAAVIIARIRFTALGISMPAIIAFLD